jgi:hypothetical protein
VRHFRAATLGIVIAQEAMLNGGLKVSAMLLQLPTHVASAFLDDEGDLRRRVRAEFNEMPGLRLTVRQAARLFGIERVKCERVLQTLVSAGVLATDGSTFTRAGAGRNCA